MKHYWNGDHDRQSEYDQLYKELVPAEGKAETVNGELIRCISRLTYEYCNNGNLNAVDVDDEYETLDRVIGYKRSTYVQLNEFYGYFLDFLRKYISSSSVDCIQDIILDAPESTNKRSYYSDDRMSCYDKVTDLVLDYIKYHEDTKLI